METGRGPAGSKGPERRADRGSQSLRSGRFDRKIDALERVQEALSHLRGIDSVTAMMDKAVAEVCRTCGFDRCVLHRVQGSKLVAEAVHIRGDEALAKKTLDFARETPPELREQLIETEMLRRGGPMLVTDPANDPSAFNPLIEFEGVSSYVAAPIMPEGRVIGFLHANRISAPLDTVDRDALWTFAEGFGYAIEGAILFRRLRLQRDQLRELTSSSEKIVNELTDASIELIAGDRERASAARTATHVLSSSDYRLDALLTRREIEAIELMAQGLTNAAIANRLAISEATVKHHVKHILRKLRAPNRAAAVARYLTIVRNEPA